MSLSVSSSPILDCAVLFHAVLCLAVMYYIVPVPCHDDCLDALPCGAVLCLDVLYCARLGFALSEVAAVLRLTWNL